MSLRGKIWSALINFSMKRIDNYDGSFLKVTTSEKSLSNSNFWKKFKNFNITETFINSVKVIEFDPKSKKNENIILYLHGGAYIACGPETHASLVTQLSKYSGSKTIFPVYRLAPKHPFPAAIDDCLLVYKELIAKGIKSESISLIGDSAGGGLVMALLQILYRDNIDLPSSAVLLSPWTDLTLSGDSITSRAERDPMLKANINIHNAIQSYLNGEDPKNPLVSSIFCETFPTPPIQIHVGTEEIIYDDSVRIYEKLSENINNKVTLRVWDGMFHVFNIFCKGFLAIPEAKKSNMEIANFITENYPKK